METKPIETICVVGAGFMGAQIGLHCASYGYTVWLVYRSEASLERASQSHVKELEARVEMQHITKKEKDAILKRIHFTRDLKVGASQADLVIENVHERLELKREVFAELDRVCPSHTILATNSSSICISRIEDATQRQDRVLNAHFYPPVWQKPLVELMRGTTTSDETIERVRQFAQHIGLTPLFVLKESTGFIFNRVWRAIRKECCRVVEEGVASHEDVDRAWMIVYARPYGPFGAMDMIGLDVIRDSSMVWYNKSGDESDAPPKIVLENIERGELGVKTGKGFYTYPNPVFKDPSWLKGGKKSTR